MKLQPKDFMMGDWVLVDGNPEQLTGIDREYVHLEGNCSTKLYIGGVEPIPLTPEILEKNGIKEGWSEPFKGYNLMVLTNGYYSIEDHCLIEFKYVHELQHILKLIDIEKEIVL